MKKITIYSTLLAFALVSCTEREIVTIGETVSPVLTSALQGTELVISDANLEDDFDAFTWTAAEFGFQSAIPEYNLRMDVKGSNFANSISLGITKELGLTVGNERINQNLLTLGVTPGQKVTVEFILRATIHSDLNASSNVITVDITPYEVVIDYPKLYVPGDHNGWTFTDESSIFSMKSDDVYEGYIWLDGGEKFKLSFQPNWDSADAIIGDPDGSGTSGTLQVGNWGGNNITATQGPGYYKIVANLNNLTYQLTLTEWAITGDFNGWTFTPMIYDSASDTWSVTTDMTVGGFKFIANENWSLIYGDEEPDGKLDPGTDGNNIPIAEAGNYTIVMDLSGAPYVYSVTKN